MMFLDVDAAFPAEKWISPERFGTGVEVPENVRNSFGVDEVVFCRHQLKRLFVIPFSIGFCVGSVTTPPELGG